MTMYDMYSTLRNVKCILYNLHRHKKKSKVMTSKCENGEWSPVDTKPCQKKKKKRKVAIV